MLMGTVRNTYDGSRCALAVGVKNRVISACKREIGTERSMNLPAVREILAYLGNV